MDQNRTFLFKLSLELGVSVRHLENKMSYNEFLEYQTFYTSNPFQVDRLELQIASLTDIILKSKGVKESSAIDFMITVSEEEKQKIKEDQRATAIMQKLDDF